MIDDCMTFNPSFNMKASYRLQLLKHSLYHYQHSPMLVSDYWIHVQMNPAKKRQSVDVDLLSAALLFVDNGGATG